MQLEKLLEEYKKAIFFCVRQNTSREIYTCVHKGVKCYTPSHVIENCQRKCICPAVCCILKDSRNRESRYSFAIRGGFNIKHMYSCCAKCVNLEFCERVCLAVNKEKKTINWKK